MIRESDGISTSIRGGWDAPPPPSCSLGGMYNYYPTLAVSIIIDTPPITKRITPKCIRFLLGEEGVNIAAAVDYW